MGDTYTNLNYHIVFSTKGRHAAISPELRPRLYEYLGGAIRGEGGVLASVGGTSDHLHMLVRHRPDQPISKLMQSIKSHSSRWVRENFGRDDGFGWQDGYGAFTVSESQCGSVARYIQDQDRHHTKRNFKEEFQALLKAHGISYEERYLWV